MANDPPIEPLEPVRPDCHVCHAEMDPVGALVYACRWCRTVVVRCPRCRSRMAPSDDLFGCGGCGLVLRLSDEGVRRLGRR